MHIILGLANIELAHMLTSLFLALRRDFIGRVAVRRCCSAFAAGSGIDGGAIAELRRLGTDGVRFLQSEAAVRGERSVAGFVLTLLQKLPQS